MPIGAIREKLFISTILTYLNLSWVDRLWSPKINFLKKSSTKIFYAHCITSYFITQMAKCKRKWQNANANVSCCLDFCTTET